VIRPGSLGLSAIVREFERGDCVAVIPCSEACTGTSLSASAIAHIEFAKTRFFEKDVLLAAWQQLARQRRK
jgi:hypothetical protein